MLKAARDSLVLAFPDYRDAAWRLADAAGLKFDEIRLHRFPDGESRITLPRQLPQQVIICRSLDRPNEKLVELALAAQTARTLGAAETMLVAPYLGYMRQDTAFHPGEAVSQRIVGALLAQWFDAVLTVDPHLHRVRNLGQAVPARQSMALTSAGLMAEFLASNLDHPLLLGPDEESEQWVARVAQSRGFDFLVGRKQRLGDRQVKEFLPEAGYEGRNLVLLDDVASTGRTLEAVARALAPYRPASVSVVVTHGLFVDDAQARLEKAGVTRIWSTDSVSHPTNAIPLAHLLAQGLLGEAGGAWDEPALNLSPK